MLNQDTVIKKSKDIPWRMIEEEALVVDVDKNEVIYLNEVSASIWKKIAENESIKVEAIINSICEVFDVDKKTAETDALEFLNQLLKKEVISY